MSSSKNSLILLLKLGAFSPTNKAKPIFKRPPLALKEGQPLSQLKICIKTTFLKNRHYQISTGSKSFKGSIIVI
jgi:hypothetical protein